MPSLPLRILFVRVLEYVLNPVYLLEALSHKIINYNRFSLHSEPGTYQDPRGVRKPFRELELRSTIQYIKILTDETIRFGV